MRIIFMGTPEFAVPSLAALLDNGEQVVLVITQPDRPRGRGRKMTPPPVKVVAEKAGIPVLQPSKIKTADFLEQIHSYAPDLTVVAAYGRILPKSLIELPTLGTINVHASLLPKYRGAAPIQWAVINGEQQTGITIMQMDEGLDTGDILLPGVVPIEENDTAGTLAPRLASLGGRLLIDALSRLRGGTLKAVRQDDDQATLAPLLTKEDGHIDWSLPAFKISCLIRGLDPWPTAFSFLEKERLRFFKPSVLKDKAAAPPGTIVRADDDGLVIGTGENQLLVSEIQREGSRRMPVKDYLLGHPLKKGAVFG
jgi:methionyl-tRNA formyltransferase